VSHPIRRSTNHAIVRQYATEYLRRCAPALYLNQLHKILQLLLLLCYTTYYCYYTITAYHYYYHIILLSRSTTAHTRTLETTKLVSFMYIYKLYYLLTKSVHYAIRIKHIHVSKQQVHRSSNSSESGYPYLDNEDPKSLMSVTYLITAKRDQCMKHHLYN